MGMSLSRKKDHAIPAYNRTLQAVPASYFELEPASTRPSRLIVQEILASSRASSKLEATPASTRASKFVLEATSAEIAHVARASSFALETPSAEIACVARSSNFALEATAAEIACVARASDFALEATAAEIAHVARASNFALEAPPAVTLQPEELPEDRETATWIRKEAQAIHIPQESYVDPRSQSVVSIFRVPNFLKETKNKKAYVPQIVSLGPYHSNRFELSGMDKHKKRALHRMMTRFNNIRHPTDSDNMESSFRAIEKIFQDEDKIRNSYEEKIDCTSEHLAVMLTLDGCFTLEILRTLGGNKLVWEGNDNYEPIFERRKIEFTGFDILNDILMLENQIPLIVLRNLLKLEFNTVDEAEKFLFDVLVKTPGTKFYPFDYKDDMKKWSWPPPDEQVHHFLSLLHSLIVSPISDDGDERAIQIDNNGKEKSGKDDRFIPPAVKLSNAGIKFQRRNGGIKKIYFDRNKATIYLPPVNVTDHTEVLFRNLIALELCQASGMNYVTCYLSLMNKLIDTEKDVALLRNSAIVKNYLGSDSVVAELFNGLCKVVALPRKDVFEDLQDDVMKHYGSKFKVWFAQFMKDYFSSPWKLLALAGAIIALLLTLVQTVFSILQVYK